MTQDEIIEMARQAGFERLGHTDKDWVCYPEDIEAFANLVAQRERDKVYAMQLELPEPRLTGKFSITMGKFKCSGCFGTWTDREDAKHHSCKDYQ
jgi:hypothetical protein